MLNSSERKSRSVEDSFIPTTSHFSTFSSPRRLSFVCMQRTRHLSMMTATRLTAHLSPDLLADACGTRFSKAACIHIYQGANDGKTGGKRKFSQIAGQENVLFGSKKYAKREDRHSLPDCHFDISITHFVPWISETGSRRGKGRGSWWELSSTSHRVLDSRMSLSAFKLILFPLSSREPFVLRYISHQTTRTSHSGCGTERERMGHHCEIYVPCPVSQVLLPFRLTSSSIFNTRTEYVRIKMRHSARDREIRIALLVSSSQTSPSSSSE